MDPDRGDWQYSYDGLGRLQSQVDAKQTSVTFTYDELSRRVARSVTKNGVTTTDAQWYYDSADGSNSSPSMLAYVVGADGYSKSYAY